MATQHTVIVKEFAYTPKQITIQVGDSVIWKNEGIHDHSATRTNLPKFDETVAVGLTSKPVIFEEASDEAGFQYFCVPHPFMKGSIIVSKAPTDGAKS